MLLKKSKNQELRYLTIYRIYKPAQKNMRWTVDGKLRWHCDSSYRIDWNRKAPSKIAQTFKDFLYKNFRYNILYEEYRIPRTLLKIDFLDATKRIAYEISGEQHREFNKFFYNNSRNNYLNAIKRDVKKEKFLKTNNYKLIELFEEDIKQLTIEFLNKKILED